VIALLFRLAVTFAPVLIAGRESNLWILSVITLGFFEIVAALAPGEAPLRFMAWVLWLIVAVVCVVLAVLS
jgi:hypothetical protein